MGTLRDEAYEKLDYLSQLTEVVVGPQNAILAQAPECVTLSYEMVDKLRQFTWGRANIFEIRLDRVLVTVFKQNNLPLSGIEHIASNYMLKVSDDFEIDFVSKTMTGAITLVKHKPQIDEKRLLELALADALNELNYCSWPAAKLKERVVVVLNTLEANRGIEWAKQLEGRVARQGHNAISALLTDVIKENKWRIRDTSVIVKIGEWINSYLSGTDGTGLVNLMKLKIMLNKDLPIYSVDEVTCVKPA